MKEFVEKLIGRLEEEKSDWNDDYNVPINNAINIVNQLAEEHKTEREKVVSELLKGEWVDTKDVEMYLGIDFKLGLKIFDFSRTAEWWSIVGRTDEERARNGQKITTEFKLKNRDNDFCEWKKKYFPLGGWEFQSDCKKRSQLNAKNWKFCPYCGKKIKVVE